MFVFIIHSSSTCSNSMLVLLYDCINSLRIRCTYYSKTTTSSKNSLLSSNIAYNYIDNGNGGNGYYDDYGNNNKINNNYNTDASNIQYTIFLCPTEPEVETVAPALPIDPQTSIGPTISTFCYYYCYVDLPMPKKYSY